MIRRLFFIFSLLFLPRFLQGQDQIAIPSKINTYLLQNTVSGLAKDGAGYLWVGSQFGILRYDGFKATSFTTNKLPSLLSNRFGHILSIPGTKDFVTYNEFESFLLSKGEIKPFPLSAGEIIIANENSWIQVKKKRIPSLISQINRRIAGSRYILFFPKDTLIFQEGKGLFSLANQTYLPNTLAPKRYLFTLHKQSFAMDATGIYRLSLANHQLHFQLIFKQKGPKQFISSSQGLCFFQNQNRIYQWDEKTNSIVQQFDSKIFGGHPAGSILSEKGVIYAGTGTSGVLESRMFPGHLLKQYAGNSPSDNYIYSYAWNPILKQYISVSPKGLSAFTSPTKNNLLVAGTANPSFVYSDFTHRIWFEKGAEGLVVYDVNKRRITHKIPAFTHIKQVVQTDATHFLFTGQQDVFHWNEKTSQIDTLFHVSGQDLVQTTLAKNGQLYIGTMQGLYLAQNGKFRKILANRSIRSLLYANDSTLLIGTYSHGVYQLVKGKLRSLSLDDRSFLSATVSMSLDTEGDVWVSTNRGVFIWKKKTLLKNLPPDYFLETVVDLPAQELNGGPIPGLYQNNEILLPSSDGLIQFSKKDILTNSTIQEIALSSLTVDGNRIRLDSSILLSPSHKSILFDLSIAFSDNPNQFHIEYRLKGLDNNWTKLPFSRQISFNRLPAGSFTLEVRDHTQARPIQLLSFQIKRFWYLQPWVWFMAFIIGVLVTSAIYYGRIILYKRNQLALNNTIRERTKELQESLAHLALSKKNLRKEYRQRNKLYSILMHDLTSPLQFLSNFSTAEFKKENPEKESLRIIAETSNELSGFIQEFLFWLKRQNDNYSLQPTRIDVNTVLQDSIHFYEAIAQLKQNKILFFSTQTHISLRTDVDILKVILRNLLDNANKFTQNGVIKISTDSNENQVTICIEDSGQGLPEHLLKLLEQPITNINYDPSINANHKMGLQISREFVALLGGQITVESTVGVGTKFTLHFTTDK